MELFYNLKSRFKNIVASQSERSSRIYKNIFLLFFIRGASVLVGLLLIPIAIDYVSAAEYGIWLTISSLVAWISNFDMGMGNSMRNEIAHTIALNKQSKLKVLVSSSYAFTLILSFCIFLLFYFTGSFFNWGTILNVPEEVTYNINLIVLIVLGCFCLQFVMQLINSILSATHQPFKSALINLIIQLTCLVTLYFLKDATGNLTILISIMAGTPVIIYLVASAYLFKTDLKLLAPNLKSIDIGFAKKMLRTGSTFFFIQLGALVLYQTDNIIIANILGHEAVTTFNVAYKLFQVIILLFSIVSAPYWSAFTDAYAKKDFPWIKNTLKEMRIFWLRISIATILLSFASDFIFRLWLGDTIEIPQYLPTAMAFYVIAFIWHCVNVDFLNGIGKIRLQLILITFCAVINIPLAVFLGKQFGLAGVISANTIAFLIMGVVFYIQSQKIVNQTAINIWNR